jgi:Methyltransferase domain
MSTRRKFGLLLTSAAFVSVISLGNAPYIPKEPMMTQRVQAQTEVKPAEREPDVVYVPTAYEVVEQMLELANVTGDDILYDLGSGDGRIPITAAQKFGTQGVGIDINPERIQEANENARQAGVTDRVKFLQQDLFTSNFSEATVVTLYLLPELNLKLRPELFRQLKPGTRVVSNAFDMGDWKPDRVVQTKGGSTIYLWIIPEQVPANLLSN